MKNEACLPFFVNTGNTPAFYMVPDTYWRQIKADCAALRKPLTKTFEKAGEAGNGDIQTAYDQLKRSSAYACELFDAQERSA